MDFFLANFLTYLPDLVTLAGQYGANDDDEQLVVINWPATAHKSWDEHRPLKSMLYLLMGGGGLSLTVAERWSKVVSW